MAEGAALEQLIEREQILRVILDRTADTIVRFDPELRYDYVNERAAEIVGLPVERWMGRTQVELGFPADDAAEREARIRAVFETGEASRWEDQITNLAGDRWYETQLFPQFAADGSVAHVIVVSRDITDRRQAEEALVRAAERDPLTGLPNRTAVLAAIDRAMGDRADTAVLLVDLDRFKDVNDALGHAVGDELLCQAARRLAECTPPATIVARHSGDEFVVVLRGTDATAAHTHAECIVEAFRVPVRASGSDLLTTASVGIALAPAGSRRDGHDLLREADTAMYVAKEAGRDGVATFDDALHAAVDERLRIHNDLRVALRKGELAMWYQPEIELATGQVRAVEALLRWHHPSGEVYPAGRFIEVAADTGLIVEIGDWALPEICAQAARWPELTVRMNLAPRQLDDPGLLDKLDAAVAAHPGGRLCVEITEMALLHDTATVRDNVSGLRERGVTLALDDFGTGFASLTYLQRYHVDVIKIDRSFVRDIADDERDRRLAAAVVALAHQLDMTVTAEGVERPEQEAVVRELGCAGAQGFLYGPAVPATEIDQRLAAT